MRPLDPLQLPAYNFLFPLIRRALLSPYSTKPRIKFKLSSDTAYSQLALRRRHRRRRRGRDIWNMKILSLPHANPFTVLRLRRPQAALYASQRVAAHSKFTRQKPIIFFFRTKCILCSLHNLVLRIHLRHVQHFALIFPFAAHQFIQFDSKWSRTRARNWLRFRRTVAEGRQYGNTAMRTEGEKSSRLLSTARK